MLPFKNKILAVGMVGAMALGPALHAHAEAALSLQVSKYNFNIDNGSSSFDPGSRVSLTVSLEALNGTAYFASAKLGSADACIKMVQASSFYGNINAGQTVDNSDAPFSFSIVPSCRLGHTVDLVLTMTANSYSTSRSLVITVGAPVNAAPSGTSLKTSTLSPPSALSNAVQPADVSGKVITVLVGANGSISPSGGVSVAPGGQQVFTITPSAGYKTAFILADGVPAAVGSSYTFTNVTADHTLIAYFVPLNTSPPQAANRPAAPNGLDGRGLSSSTINLTWNDNANDEDAFVIERSNDPSGQRFFSPFQVLDSSIKSFLDTHLSPSTKYSYRVLAINNAGMSAPSYSFIATTLSDFVDTGHPQPPRTNGWDWATIGPMQGRDLIEPGSERPGNLFFAGQPLTFVLAPYYEWDNSVVGLATHYEVRNFYGSLVDSGTIADPADLTVKPLPPGWYKLYLFGNEGAMSAISSTWTSVAADTLGGTEFAVLPDNHPFNSVALLRANLGGGEFDYIKRATRIDPVVNSSVLWPNGTLPAAIGSLNPAGAFAVVWSGQLIPTASGSYTFSFNTCGDLGLLWIDGKLVARGTSCQGINTGALSLAAGTSHSIRVDYFTASAPNFTLSWALNGASAVPVPTSVLYSSSNQSTPNGLTADYYGGVGEEGPDGDETVRAMTMMGPTRYEADPTNPTTSIAQISEEIAIDQQLYMSSPYYDPQRPRALEISFGSGTEGHLAGVQQIVAAFKDKVQYYEGRNEPQGTDMPTYINEIKDLYNTVKGVSSSLKVIGPGPVSIDPGSLPWIDAFFAAGGGNYIDAFSFHAYNTVNGSLDLARHCYNGLQAVLDKYGYGNIEKWQTEQGYFAAMYGIYDPVHEANWTMMQKMVFEQYGIPKEHDVLWYDVSHGFWDFPAWWENAGGGVNPAVPLMAVWAQELYGTSYVSAYDFGPSANKLFAGSLFSSADASKRVAVFLSDGSTDVPVTLNVTGARVHTVDAWGNAQDLAVSNGQVSITPGQLPLYVELAPGQQLSVLSNDWGNDLALGSGVSASASALNSSSAYGMPASNNINMLYDGTLENWYYAQGSSLFPWAEAFTPGQSNWVEMDLPQAQYIGKVVVRAPNPWQSQGAPLDYELQYYDDSAGQWVNIEHVQEDTKVLGIYSNDNVTSVDSYYSNRHTFVHSFPVVFTDKIRLVVNNVTYGGGANLVSTQGGGQYWGSQWLSLQEIEIYNSYTLNVQANNGGQVALTPDQASYSPNAQVTLTAVPAAGSQFSSWSGDASGSGNPVTLVMNGNKSVSANFTALPAGSSTLNVFSTYGDVTESPQANAYPAGTAVTLTAEPHNGYQFTSWSGDVNSTDNPLSVTVNNNMNITANYTLMPAATYTLNMQCPVYGSVTVNPVQDVYAADSTVTVTATPAAGYEFLSWNGDISGSQNPAAIVMNGNKNVTAVFAGFNGTACVSNPDCLGGYCANGHCSDGSNGSKCSSNANCQSGLCLTGSGLCASGKLANGDLCGSNTDCAGGYCGQSGSNAPLCTDGSNGSECTAGGQCQSGICIRNHCTAGLLPNGSTCSSNADCAGGYCSQSGSNAPVCTDGSNGSRCLNNAQCHNGNCKNAACSDGLNDGSNGASCTSSSQCSGGHCVSGICTSGANGSYCADASDCAGGFCVYNACTDGSNGSECRGINANCKSGHCSGTWTCIAGPLPNGANCGADADCSGGHCVSGGCTDGSIGSECRGINTDCQSGLCSNWACVAPTYFVAVTAVNGTAVQRANGVVTSGKYAGVTTVSLTAIPAAGYQFVSWTGDAAGTSNPMTVTVAGNMNITANFTAQADQVPVITVQPGSQSVNVGQSVTFHVAATGTAPLSYQWQKNGANIAGASNASYTTNLLTLLDNGSRYNVVVSNAAGSVTSAAATLTVAVEPFIKKRPTPNPVTLQPHLISTQAPAAGHAAQARRVSFTDPVSSAPALGNAVPDDWKDGDQAQDSNAQDQ